MTRSTQRPRTEFEFALEEQREDVLERCAARLLVGGEAPELAVVPCEGRDAIITRAAAARLTTVHYAEHVADLGPGQTFTATPRLADGAEGGEHLDEAGRVRIGTEVRPGHVLVGRHGPRGDASVYCRPDARGRVTNVVVEDERVTILLTLEATLEIGDVLRCDGAVATVGQIVDHLEGADLAWPSGPRGLFPIEKVGRAEDVLHARSIGPYSVATRQPLHGKASFGGQALTAPTIDALMARGAKNFLHELWTEKADSVESRVDFYKNIVLGEPRCAPTMPYATQTLERLLLGLGLVVDLGAASPSLRLATTEDICALGPGLIESQWTLDEETHAPVPGGLFCEELFGPIGSPERSTRFARIAFRKPLVHPLARGLPPAERASFLVEAWPVLPPDLRPLVPLPNGLWAVSSLNDLYRALFVATNRSAQNALGELAFGSRRNGRPLVGLLQLLGGDGGALEQPRRGKHVDYSGVARAVVRPDLAPGCAVVPREVALELRKPWLYHLLERDGHVTTIKEAKRRVRHRTPDALAALAECVADRPMVLVSAAAPARIAAVDVALWDEPAIGLSSRTLAELDLGADGVVLLHVPVDPRAVEEARRLARGLRGVPDEPAEIVDDGWLSRAARATVEALPGVLFAAARERELDPVRSSVARLLLGRTLEG